MFVAAWLLAGKLFQVEELAEPVRKGASMRHYQMFCDGHREGLHSTLEDARRRAEHVSGSYHWAENRRLEARIGQLEHELRVAKGEAK